MGEEIGDCVSATNGEHGESVGRMVHYVNLGDKDGKYPPEIISALVTKVNADGTVALKCFYATGLFDTPSIPYSRTYQRGHWSWPVAMRSSTAA